MASTARPDLSPKEWKLLTLASGNRCAFPKCGRPLSIPGNDAEDGVILGEAAHIVGASRCGPRGDFEIADQDRDRSARNRILLCADHHKLIDARPLTYTPQVLLAMKQDHEVKQTAENAQPVAVSLKSEELRSSLLPISALPSFVMSLPLSSKGMREGEVASKIVWPRDRNVLVPFVVRDKRLYTFGDLSGRAHPFTRVVAQEKPEITEARELWSDPEGHRRYVALLNKCLTKHLNQRGLLYDREHHRYWFTAEPGPAIRTVRYKNKQGHQQVRNVVHQRIRKTTNEGKEWWHVAAGLRFERVGEESWVLSLRPEFEATADGITPLPPKVHSAKSARRKAKIYNNEYLNLLHFWLEFLMTDQPRLVLQAIDQRIIIEGNLLNVHLDWPGVKDDRRAYVERDIPENLFSAHERDEAEGTLSLDDSWWQDDESDGEDM